MEDRGPKTDYGALVNNAALPEGKRNKPLAGLIYFPYGKKLKTIRRLELLVDDTAIQLR